MTLPPQPWPGIVASLLFLAAMTLWIVLARRYPGIIRNPRPALMSQLEPPPERQALPPQPLVVVLGDMYWSDRHMAEQMVAEMIRVARGHGEIGAEAVRELTAARQVVRGELAL